MAQELQVEDAHEIAVDWGRRLARVADLELDVSVEQQIPAYNRLRVRFEVGNADLVTTPMTRDTWCVLRETLAIWRALTCCPGFGGKKSLDFWDRVAGSLALRTTTDGGICSPSSSEEALHHAGDTFRLTLCISITALDADPQVLNLATLEDGFKSYIAVCSTDGVSAEGSRDLKPAWRRIKPCMDASRLAQLGSIPTHMELEAFRYDPCTAFLDSLPTVVEKITQLGSVQSRRSAAKSAKYPLLKLQGLCLKDWRAGSSIQLEKLAVLLRTLSVPVFKLGMCLETIDDHDAHSHFVRGALGLEQIAGSSGSNTGSLPSLRSVTTAPLTAALKQLSMMYESLDTQQFVALLSALPYTRSVEALQLASEGSDSYFEMSAIHAAWIGYALFHPRTQTSSWRRLSLRYWRRRDEARTLMELVQMVVDPLRMLSTARLANHASGSLRDGDLEAWQRDGGAKRADALFPVLRADKFQLARAKKGAQIYTKRSSDDDDEAPWITLQCEMRLEMCDVDDDACAFHCVLVPGYGFGWIRKVDVVEVQEWVVEMPLVSPLTCFECDTMFPVRSTQLLLSAIGKNLKTLRMGVSPEHKGILDDVAQACPKLRHLRIVCSEAREAAHTLAPGSLTRFFARSTSRVQSLSLSWELGTVQRLVMLLGNHGPDNCAAVAKLKRLELYNVDVPDELNAMADSFDSMLCANKSLEELLLAIGFNAAILRDCPLLAHNNEDLTLHATLRRRLAFLSVVYTAQRGSKESLRLLDANMVTIVLQFALPRVYRRVSVYSQPF